MATTSASERARKRENALKPKQALSFFFACVCLRERIWINIQACCASRRAEKRESREIDARYTEGKNAREEFKEEEGGNVTSLSFEVM